MTAKNIIPLLLTAWVFGSFIYLLYLIQTAYGSKSIESFIGVFALLGIMAGYFYFGYIVAKEGTTGKQIGKGEKTNGTRS